MQQWVRGPWQETVETDSQRQRVVCAGSRRIALGYDGRGGKEEKTDVDEDIRTAHSLTPNPLTCCGLHTVQALKTRLQEPK